MNEVEPGFNSGGVSERDVDHWQGPILIRGDVKVEWEWIGEGMSGDYDPADQRDTPFLRFTVSHRAPAADWESVDDASYCTLVTRDTPATTLESLLVWLMDEFYEPVSEGHSVKKLGERMSWIRPDGIKEVK